VSPTFAAEGKAFNKPRIIPNPPVRRQFLALDQGSYQSLKSSCDLFAYHRQHGTGPFLAPPIIRRIISISLLPEIEPVEIGFNKLGLRKS